MLRLFVLLFGLMRRLAMLLYHALLIAIFVLSAPFHLLAKIPNLFIKAKSKENSLIPDSLNNAFSAFNGFLSFLLFFGSLLFVVIAFLAIRINGITPSMYVENILSNTTVGSVLAYITDGMDLEPATLLSIAFPSYLSVLCLSKLNKQGINAAGNPVDIKPPFYIYIPCFIVYLVSSSTLAFLLNDVLQIVCDWVITQANALSFSNTSFFVNLGNTFLLVLLGYILLLLTLIAIKEYAEALLFGITGFAVFAIVLLVADSLSPGLGQNTIFTLSLFGLDLVITEYCRVHFVGIYEDRCHDELGAPRAVLRRIFRRK